MISLHIGFPKTATTSLQTSVFDRIPGAISHHSRLHNSDRYAQSLLRRFVKVIKYEDPGTYYGTKSGANLIADLIGFRKSRLGIDGRLLISHEDMLGAPFFGWSDPAVFGQAPGRRHPVVDHICAINSSSGGLIDEVVVTVRRQDQLLASLYSHVSLRIKMANLGDFRRGVSHLLEDESIFGHRYLDYSVLIEQLISTLGGRAAVHILPVELIGTSDYTARLGRLLAELSPGVEAPCENLSLANVKRAADGAWPIYWRGRRSLRSSLEQSFLPRWTKRSLLSSWNAPLRIVDKIGRLALDHLDAVEAKERILLTDDFLASVRSRYRDSNAAFARAYCPALLSVADW